MLLQGILIVNFLIFVLDFIFNSQWSTFDNLFFQTAYKILYTPYLNENFSVNSDAFYYKDNLFLEKTEKVGFIETGSEIEALILEANLIKKIQPNRFHSLIFFTSA